MTTQKLNKIIRRSLRLLAVIVLLVMAIFRIIIPVIENKPIYLAKNDGYVIGFAFLIAVAVEAARALAVRSAKGLSNKFFGNDKTCNHE